MSISPVFSCRVTNKAEGMHAGGMLIRVGGWVGR